MYVTKVVILEKEKNGVWSPAEQNALIRASVEFEMLPAKPNKIVAMNKPLSGATFTAVLGHSNFTQKEVDFRNRWA